LSTAIQGVRNRAGIVLVIAHRPSALSSVDHVAMINAGQLSAFGPKEEVLKKVLIQPVRTAVS
jgi:ABC-type protease/lipase transport system fused ATPase/permease subunit